MNASLIILCTCVCLYWAFLLYVICRLSVIWGVVALYLPTCTLLINVLINRQNNILTIIIITLLVNESCVPKGKFPFKAMLSRQCSFWIKLDEKKISSYQLLKIQLSVNVFSTYFFFTANSWNVLFWNFPLDLLTSSIFKRALYILKRL